MMELGSGRSLARLEWQLVGEDLLVTITGGERSHIGAAALAYPADGAVTVQTLTAPGHKEEPLARTCAEAVCRKTGRTVLVSCGLHIDHARPEEIQVLCRHVRQLEEQLLSQLETK